MQSNKIRLWAPCIILHISIFSLDAYSQNSNNAILESINYFEDLSNRLNSKSKAFTENEDYLKPIPDSSKRCD